MEAERSTPPTAKNIRKGLRKLRRLKLEEENAQLYEALADLRKSWSEREAELQELHHQVALYGMPAELHKENQQLKEIVAYFTPLWAGDVSMALAETARRDHLRCVLRDLQDATCKLEQVLNE